MPAWRRATRVPDGLGVLCLPALPPSFLGQLESLLASHHVLPDGWGIQIALYRPYQLGGIEWLAYIVSRACQLAAHTIDHAVFATEQQDRQIAIILVMVDNMADLVSIHLGEEDIEQHEVGLGVSNSRKRSQTIARRHDFNALTP